MNKLSAAGLDRSKWAFADTVTDEDEVFATKSETPGPKPAAPLAFLLRSLLAGVGLAGFQSTGKEH
jgi:hypothetical protein